MRIRPMTAGDVTVAEQISDEAFHASDLALHRPGTPAPTPRTPEHSARWIARTRTMVATDPGGCVVADVDGAVVGFATGFRREALWCLATFAVRPERQGGGVGRALLDAAVAYAEPCPRWMVSASADPAALRCYERAGFRLVPQSMFFGAPAAPAPAGGTALRPGTDADHGWIDELDRAIRGGSHAPDRAALAASGDLVVAEDRSGYLYARASSVALLAAADTASAELLLRHALAHADPGFELHHVSAANPWARHVALEAGMTESPRGHLGIRGMEPPTAYLHNGALL